MEQHDLESPFTIKELATQIRCVAYSYYLACLHSGYDSWESLKNVQPGDLVCETSTVYHNNADRAVGRLISITEEPCFTEEEWAEDHNYLEEGQEIEPIPTEKCFNIKRLNGEMIKWTNASFILVPKHIK